MRVTESLPRLVVLFSGHMIDAPERSPSRFPPQFEDAAAASIRAALDRLEVGSADLAICGGAAGGDLLFAEACIERGVSLEILIPFDQEAFLATSVDPGGAGWRERFHRVATDGAVSVTIASESAEGPLRSGAFERNNQRMLERSVSGGAERLRFVALWDGGSGDGVGGTAAMVEAVRRRTDAVHIIDSGTLTAS